MKKFTHNQGIDFLRGIAILLVLLLHFQLAYHLGSIMDLLAGNGNYGVTIFFVISGFLITSISLKRYQSFATINIYEFYLFRFARVIPCLILALGLITMFNLFDISIFKNKHAVSYSETILSVLMFWHNILMEKVGYFNYCINIYWSLSVEEVFYFIFPILSIFLKKKQFIITFWLFLIILCPFYRSYYADNEIISLYSNFSCFDAISIGCLCAVQADKINLPKIYTWIAIAGMMFIYFYKGIMDNIILGPTLIALFTGILLIKTNALPHLKIFKYTKLIGLFGKNSYELYLFHIIILAIIKSIIPYNILNIYEKLLLLLAFLIVSFIICNLIAKIYSEPINKYLRSLYFLPLKRESKCNELQ